MILQELFQGAVPDRAREKIGETFAALEYLTPLADDHVAAATVHSTVPAAGVQIGTIDALIAHLAIAGSHTLLTTDKDLQLTAQHVALHLWIPAKHGDGRDRRRS